MELKDPIELHLQRVNALDRRQYVRPMTSSELMERAARVYQLCAKQILAKSAIPALFCFISLIFITTFLLPELFFVEGGSEISRDIVRIAIASLLTIFLAIPLFMFGLGQSFAVAVNAVRDYITGDRLPGEEQIAPDSQLNIWKFTLMLSIVSVEAFLPILIASTMFILGAVIQGMFNDSIVPGLLAFFGFLAAVAAFFVCPALLMRRSLVPVVMLIENKATKSARQRGTYLAKGHQGVSGISESMLHALVVLFFVVLGLIAAASVATNLFTGIGAIENWLGSVVFGDILKSAINLLPFYIVLWLITPYWATLCTATYYDRLIRIEGFDIRVLASDVLEVRE